MTPRRLPAAGLAVVASLTVAMAGCGGGTADDTPREVVLVTHDSFAVSKGVLTAFERETGLRVRLLQSGDAGTAVNRALLTAGDPEGDVFFGVDDSLLSRALAGNLFVPYVSPALDQVDDAFPAPDERVTPIDHGDVCLNVDRKAFGAELAPPRTLEDLAAAPYRDMLVVENPATSSPGLAFLLATIATYGEDGWERYWERLRENGVLVVDGWEEAYTQQFSGAAGSPGDRPIVVSYATSPAAEVIFAGTPLTEAPTAVIEEGCFRQVEYAAILDGARNEQGARALIDFMLSERFQEDVPGSMFVYPVRTGTRLPDAFERFAVRPERPLSLDPEAIDSGRDRWIDRWTEIVLR